MDETYNATQQAGDRNVEGHDTGKSEQKQVNLPATLEELQRLLQIEGDRRVTQALKTASKKWQQELMHRLEAERSEAERLAALTAERCEKEALEKYRREIEEKERALKYKELEIEVIYLLAENKLPLEFKEFILDRDEETTLKKADIFCRLWREKMEEAVREAVMGGSPGIHS